MYLAVDIIIIIIIIIITLRRQVLPKPSNDAQTLDALVGWMDRHGFLADSTTAARHRHSSSRSSSSGSSSSANKSGIVYCFSRKDADNVAAGLCARGVRAGSYHAGCDEADKERVHEQWFGI